jgi:haloalkane dehalogenase
MIQRDYVQVKERLVHFRHAGQGPPILLVHQSPKSSAEFEALMTVWSATNLVIAPDSPGFGQSDPLANETADVDDFARALLDFLDVLGVQKIPVYGFHSGAVFAVAAAKMEPARFTAVVCNGYAVWTEAEIKAFGAKYLPPFRPSDFGDHLTWLWARMREQRFFFPWYEVNDPHRMALPEATAAHLHTTTMDMLYAGDAYRVGYGAVVRARRDLPADDKAIPTLIVSFDGDPLKAHLARLGTLPACWQIEACATQAETETAAKTFLDKHAAPEISLQIKRETDRRFVGDVHVSCKGDMKSLLLHAPGSSCAAMLQGFCGTDVLAPDLPGHGLTQQPYMSLAQTAETVLVMLQTLQVTPREIIADALSMPLAMMLCAKLLPEPGLQVIGNHAYTPAQIEKLRTHYLTEITPDKNGFYLLQAWRRVRDSCLFDPWFDNGPSGIKTVDVDALRPERLAVAHLAAVQAHGGQQMLNDILDIYQREKNDGNS